MDFGKKLKNLRLKKEATQEQVANYLNVSAQAVSKWENNASYPDVTLLPEISVYFGVSIDELFDMTEDARLERIDNMLCTKDHITKEEFDSANDYLKSRLIDDNKEGKTLGLLADLYNHKADEYRKIAEYYAKEALLAEPENKDHHVSLREAQQGSTQDWDFANHSKRIAYYQDFIQKNPTYPRGYLWLLDELFADHRINDARQVLKTLRTLDHSCRIPYYDGWIKWEEGDHDAAMAIWKSIPEQFPNDWLAYAETADACAHVCAYEDAIAYYRKAKDIQPSPKYTDAPLTIAQIRELQGRIPEAIEAWNDVIETLKTEWHRIDGFEREEAEIKRLKSLLD